MTDIWQPRDARCGLGAALGPTVDQVGFRFQGIVNGRAWIFAAPETTAQLYAQAMGAGEPFDQEGAVEMLVELGNIMLSRIVGEFSNAMGFELNHREPSYSRELNSNPMFFGTDDMVFFRTRMRLNPPGGTPSGELMLVIACTLPTALLEEISTIRSDDPRKRFLMPGDFVSSRNPGIWSTLLGSCVSVCLLNRTTGDAAMGHFLISHSNGRPDVGRYGDTSLGLLWWQLKAWDPVASHYEARIYGGANMFSRHDTFQIGSANVAYARAAMANLGIRVAEEQVGGDLGRYVVFDTAARQVTWRFCEVAEEDGAPVSSKVA